MKQLNTQAMEKALGHIVQNLGVDCLKDSKRFHSSVADLLPGFEYEAERKALCACICLEVSEKIINTTSKSQSEKQRILNSCVKYLTSQQKLTEQQADKLVKVFTHILWKGASSGSSQASNSATKNTVTSQATVVRSITVGNTSPTKQTTPTAKEPTWRDPTSNISATKQTVTTNVIGIDSLSSKKGRGLEFVADLHRKAEQGDAVAQCDLGYCYHKGDGISKDYTEAVKWYRKAAEQGNAVAQNNLGVCYYNGEGVSKDYTKAAEWYRKSAEQGNAIAQNNLGVCYYNGEGVSKNYTRAVKWYRKAAEQGNADAQYNLGVCYYNGEGVNANIYGVNANIYEAIKWCNKAVEQGHDSQLASMVQTNIKIFLTISLVSWGGISLINSIAIILFRNDFCFILACTLLCCSFLIFLFLLFSNVEIIKCVMLWLGVKIKMGEWLVCIFALVSYIILLVISGFSYVLPAYLFGK